MMDQQEQIRVSLLEVAYAAEDFICFHPGRRKDPAVVKLAEKLEEFYKARAGERRFICPKCGGCFFGMVNPMHGADEAAIYKCHGDSSLGCRSCDWQGPFKFGAEP